MIAVALLCGVFTAGGIYLLLAGETWRRLGGLVLMGDAVALLSTSAGGESPAAMRVGVALVLAAFGLFFARAALARLGEGNSRMPQDPSERAEE
ncbi:MAG TPA: hypothetical protein VEH07_06325 [Alphaproteobacteria bacterium]|nr:hypothetical protein [Alphaproteobacteria bacterium]